MREICTWNWSVFTTEKTPLRDWSCRDFQGPADHLAEGWCGVMCQERLDGAFYSEPGEAHSLWTASQTYRELPWDASRNRCDPPRSLPSISLLRTGVLNVPCFLAGTGPSHPVTSPVSLSSTPIMENSSRKGHNGVYTYITDGRGGQMVWTVFSGSRQVILDRQRFQKKKTALGLIDKFPGFMLLRLSNPETPDRLKLKLLKSCGS